MELGQIPSLRPELATRPALLRLLSLLPTPAADLESIVARAVADNPLLERRPGRPCAGCGRHCRDGWCRECRSLPLPAEPGQAGDWREELEQQARLELPARLHPLLADVVGSLDDHGFLTRTPTSERTELAAVLTAVRVVGPTGIAARDAFDCLAVQVEDLRVRAVVTEPYGSWLAALVAYGLAALADQDWDELAEITQIPADEIPRVAELLRRHTRPFVALPGTSTRVPAPDVTFRLQPDGSVTVDTPNADALGLRRLAAPERLDAEARAWLEPHRRAADQLITALDARAGMLRRLAEVLVVEQRAFVIDGSEHRPLSRVAIARHLGVHPSTIGRAAAGKVAACPGGRRVDLADFFGAGPAQLRAVREVIGDLPGASDATLAAELARRGSPLARRTVTKYRHLLQRT